MENKETEILEDIEALNEATDRDDALFIQSPTIYTHVLERPIERDGKQYESLTFDYSCLTGRNSLSFEQNVLTEFRKNVVIPALSSEYLVNMAARACTDRDEQGKPFVNVPFLLDLPIRDFLRICASARRFLQRLALS